MIAGSRLQLNREPLTALAFSIMLLAFARDRAEQAALRQDSSLAVLTLLLQVRSSKHDRSQPGIPLGTRRLTCFHMQTHLVAQCVRHTLQA